MANSPFSNYRTHFEKMVERLRAHPDIALLNFHCPVVEVANRIPKVQRILGALDPILAARRLSAHESVFRTRFPQEMATWRPDTLNARDDALDALAGCIAAEPVRLPTLPPRGWRADWRGG